MEEKYKPDRNCFVSATFIIFFPSEWRIENIFIACIPKYEQRWRAL